MDRRTTAANGRVADVRLTGTVEAETFVEGWTADVGVPVADLLRDPGGRRDRQLLWGTPLRVFEEREGWAFVQSDLDDYVGYVPAGSLVPAMPRTHRVCVQATHLYSTPDIKAPEAHWLSFGSRLRVVSASGAFFETEEGLFVPKPHLRPLNAPLSDPATVAQLHFGVPYLWGGNSSRGIDCSGLVQAALLACGIDCPGDSDLQQSDVGTALPSGTEAQRGDLFFWKGHVAMAVDAQTLIHANAYQMAVGYERIADAVARIAEQGEGPVTAHKRL